MSALCLSVSAFIGYLILEGCGPVGRSLYSVLESGSRGWPHQQIINALLAKRMMNRYVVALRSLFMEILYF